MSGKRNHWLAVGLILTTGITSIALAVVSLAGFADAGDVSGSSITHVENLVMVMLGTMLLVTLEYVHSMRRSAGRRTSISAAARA